MSLVMFRVVVASLSVSVLLASPPAMSCPPHHPCPACGRCWVDKKQKESGGCHEACTNAPDPTHKHSPYHNVDREGYIVSAKWRDRVIPHDPPKSVSFPPAEGVSVDLPGFGTVVGDVVDDAAEYFLGIPYAATPTGNLRFMPAQEVEPIDGVLDASIFCPSVVGAMGATIEQSRQVTLPNDAKLREDEDSLCVNVWRPKGTTNSSKLPIMVWIYGGGFVSGSSTNAWYDGKNIAAYHNRIVVSLNYRVGPLGFFSSLDLVSESSGTGGSNGLMDQVAALKWVQKFGGYFGGDVNNVGLFGESAGALSVCSHLVSPKSAGLFKRAILESGPCNGPWGVGEKADGLAISQKLMTGLQCSTVDCLRAKPASDLAAWPWAVETNQSWKDSWKLTAFDWEFPGYWVDSFFLPTQQYDLFNTGTINAEAVMVIANSMDGFMSWMYSSSWSSYPRSCGASNESFDADQSYHWAYYSSEPMGAFLAELDELYPCSEGDHTGTPMSEAAWQFNMADRDYNIHCAANYLAETLQKRGVSAWRGTFGVGPRQYDEGCISGMVPCCQEGTDCYGVATHGAEIPFVFNTTSNACDSESICGTFVDPFTGHEPALVRSMQEYWTSFLATGTPVDTSGAGPTWPQADKGIAELIVPTVTIASDTLSQKCEFWSKYYPGQTRAIDLVV